MGRRQWVCANSTATNTGAPLRARALIGAIFGLISTSSAPMKIILDERKSGYVYMQPATKVIQDDDTQNPAMLWVKDGETLWSQKVGAANKSCVDCHGDASMSMRGVAARHPYFSVVLNKPINLQQQIAYCRDNRQKAETLPYEHATLLSLETYVAFQSRGMPIKPPQGAPMIAARKTGEQLYNQRIGQIDLSCRDCHSNQYGKSLAGNVIPQAHPTSYPIYRLEWQSVGSLQRRLRNCMVGVRAEPYALGAAELVSLEAYLAGRAAGMKLESPGVRP